MREDLITVAPYDASWPVLFDRQRAVLEPVLAGVLDGPIEHMGSTAVPGLAAKPIIDMLARVADHAVVPPLRDDLLRVGWVSAPEPGDEEGRRSSWCHPTVEHRTHHLHVVERDSTGWPTWLASRDHLRRRPDRAAEYADLKARLAAADPVDRPRYRAAKAPLITAILAEIDADERI